MIQDNDISHMINNFGGKGKKNYFLFVFSTYLPMFLHKFQSGELVGCRIKFRIQWVPTWHTFDRPHPPKNKKYLKKCDDDVIITFHHHVFQVFLVFGVATPIKSMSSGYSLDAEFNSTSNDLSCSKFELKHRDIYQKYEQKSSFFTINMSIQPLWLTHFIEILLVLEFQFTRIYCCHVLL